MACACPLISEKGESSGKNVTLPVVFKAPIQPDIVNFVHTSLHKNSRQPCAVSEFTGHQSGAESWVLAELWFEFPEFEAVGGTHCSG